MDFVKIPNQLKPLQFTPKHILSGKTLREFVFAGNALFTILNKDTGNYFTYRVKKHKDDDVWFVQVLNVHDYTFIGTCFEDKKFKHSTNSDLGLDNQKVKTFDWFLDKYFHEQNKFPQVEVYHHGRCGHCYKTLTTPESIKSGIGPVCGGKKYKKVTR